MRLKSLGAAVLVAMTGYAATSGVVLKAADTPPAAAATAKPKYSTGRTQLSTLLADPAAKAVLVKDVPALMENPQNLDQASGMTLRELSDAVKTYAPDLLSEKVLHQIDADLAALPAS